MKTMIRIAERAGSGLRLVILVVLGLSCVYLHGFAGGGKALAKQASPAARGPARSQLGAVRRQILDQATQAFKPSLEMKENVDFLLTPALVVQEVLSKDVVITYPTE